MAVSARGTANSKPLSIKGKICLTLGLADDIFYLQLRKGTATEKSATQWRLGCVKPRDDARQKVFIHSFAQGQERTVNRVTESRRIMVVW